MSLSITVTNNVSSQTGAVESVVLVDGEVDVSNADQLRTVLDGRVEDAPTELVVDLSKVPYIDSTGIGVLVGAAHRAAETFGSAQAPTQHTPELLWSSGKCPKTRVVDAHGLMGGGHTGVARGDAAHAVDDMD